MTQPITINPNLSPRELREEADRLAARSANLRAMAAANDTQAWHLREKARKLEDEQ